MIKTSQTAPNPDLTALKLTTRHPDLQPAGKLYKKLVRTLSLWRYQQLNGIARQVCFEERRCPSRSYVELLSRVQTARQATASMATGLGNGAMEMAVIIILMMVQDGDQDLQKQMANAQAQMNAKQAIRALLTQINNLEANLMAAGEKEAGLDSADLAALDSFDLVVAWVSGTPLRSIRKIK